MNSTLALPQEFWDQIAAKLELTVETAAVITARPVRDRDRIILLARTLNWVPDAHYLERDRDNLKIASQGYVPALGTAADDGAVALFFHTHPGGDPRPSRRDERVDEQLAEPFRIRTGQTMYGSIVVGGTKKAPRFTGRLLDGGEERPLTRLRVVGSRIAFLFAESQTAGHPRIDPLFFDRQIRAFGVAGQTLLRGVRIGIVGLGGTGSSVFELLVRLGVGEIVVIDDDTVTATNLTRIHESGSADINKPKVDVAQAAAQRIGLGTHVESHVGRITAERIARALRSCDIVFGCTDDERGRSTLSRLAYYYLVPVIDTAFMVDSQGGNIRGLFGRVTTLVPGAPCLVCRRRIDPAGLAVEALQSDERELLAAEGYVAGIGEPDPSVGTFTTMTATFAVNDLLERLFGYGPPEAPTELLIRLHDHALSAPKGTRVPGHYCDDLDVWGRGDTEPFLEQLWTS